MPFSLNVLPRLTTATLLMLLVQKACMVSYNHYRTVRTGGQKKHYPVHNSILLYQKQTTSSSSCAPFPAMRITPFPVRNATKSSLTLTSH